MTSGGIDSGARPIWDARTLEAEKHRVEVGKEGRRKAGMDTDGPELIARSRALVRVVESIVDAMYDLGDVSRFNFLEVLGQTT